MRPYFESLLALRFTVASLESESQKKNQKVRERKLFTAGPSWLPSFFEKWFTNFSRAVSDCL
jgi:hypothetical protein